MTGGCGFIGSHFLDLFVAENPGAAVVNLDLLTYCGRVDNPAPATRAAPGYRFVHGDVCDLALLRELFAQHDFDAVVHLAAETHVDNSFADSLRFTRANVEGTHCLLEAARLAWCGDGGSGAPLRSGGGAPPPRRFLMVSTDEVYGEVPEGGEARDEAAPHDPTNPYAATKAAAELLVRAYGRSYGLPWVITRGNNVYGPRQYPEKVVPRFVDCLRRGEPCPVQGGGGARRVFVHAADAARALATVLARGALHATYNVGGDDELSVAELAARLAALVRPGAPAAACVRHVPDRPFNDRRYLVKDARLRALGWEPRVPLAAGLAALVAEESGIISDAPKK